MTGVSCTSALEEEYAATHHSSVRWLTLKADSLRPSFVIPASCMSSRANACHPGLDPGSMTCPTSAHQQHRHFAVCQHLRGDRAHDQVAQRAVAVRAHHHHVELATVGGL